MSSQNDYSAQDRNGPDSTERVDQQKPEVRAATTEKEAQPATEAEMGDCPSPSYGQARKSSDSTEMAPPQIAHAATEAGESGDTDGTEVGNGFRIVAPSSSPSPYGVTSRENASIAAAKYALIHITNSTGSVIVFEFKWGNGTWRTRSLDPGISRFFWWNYASGSTSSPTLYVRKGGTNSALRRYAADEIERDQAAQYEFYSSSRIRAIRGEVFPGKWTRVAWFRYGNWSNGMYVNGVRVERYMGPSSGYNWSYRVKVVDVSLSSGLPCLPGQHWEGLVRAKVTSQDGGYLDTGDLSVHSGGGTKTQTWDEASPGDVESCILWRRTWCEW